MSDPNRSTNSANNGKISRDLSAEEVAELIKAIEEVERDEAESGDES